MTKVSVVMATCNGEKYLDDQLQSILAQTLKPAEIIVCDDVSTDGTTAILEKYRQQGLLTYFINEHRLGLIDNFKKAVSIAAATNYISLCDQDDVWMPDKLEKSVALLQKIDDDTTPCLVYTDLSLMDQHGKELNKSFRNELGQDKYQHNLHTLLFGNFVNGCTTVMNLPLSRFVADIPNDVASNHDGWLALVAFTFGKVEYIASPLVKYRKHSSNLSIPVNAKLRNRYRSALNELLIAVKGKSDFLTAQLETTHRFYNTYSNAMETDIKRCFEEFLELQGKPYIIRKIAFKRVINRFKL